MLKRILLVLFSVIILLVVIVLVQPVDPLQHDPGSSTFVFADTLDGGMFNIDSLKQLVGNNKGLPKGFELAGLLAYAAYPELKAANIDMVLTDYGAPMESNFDIWSLFGPKKKRKYRILLNDAQGTKFDQILLRSLPFDAQVGILAHELGHVAYYDRLSTLQIAKWGVMYLISDDFRAKHERSTDLMPLYHGLGNQIYQYAYYIRHDSCCVELYHRFADEFIDKYYMTDAALKEVLQYHPLYQ